MGLCKVEGAGELGSLSDGQILLLAELALQSQQLGSGERGSGLPVRLVLPQGAGSGAQVSCKEGKGWLPQRQGDLGALERHAALERPQGDTYMGCPIR